MPDDDPESVVFVIDDDASLRAALSELFASVSLRVEAFGSPADFLKNMTPPQGPSCLVLDVRLPGLSGLDFQVNLAKAGIELPIIFITGHGDVPMTVRAMKAGAIEFLTKPFRDQDLLDAVQHALELHRTRRTQQKSESDLQARYQSLTEREREVFMLVSTGLMNKQVAGELGVSEITVKVHRGHAMRKMGATTLADLIKMAQALGVSRRG
jgi:FixJ family two-component response regulator